jgi:hypothetical protein
MLAGPASRPKEQTQPAGPQEFPHVGLRIWLPAACKPDVPARPNCLYRSAVEPGKQRQTEAALTFVARRASAVQPTPRELAEEAAQPQKTDEVEVSRVLSEKVRVGKASGWRCVARIKRPGELTAAGYDAVTCWNRTLPREKLVLHYALRLRHHGQTFADAAALSAAVSETAEAIPVRRAAEAPLPPLAASAAFPKEGFEVRLPLGWWARQVQRKPGSSLVMSAWAVDLLQSNVPNYNVTVVTASEPIDFDSDQQVKRYLERLKTGLERSARQVGARWEFVSAEPKALAGQGALQIVGRVALEKDRGVMVQRQALCGDKVYTITLSWPGGDPKRALTAMENIAAGFRFLKKGKAEPK